MERFIVGRFTQNHGETTFSLSNAMLITQENILPRFSENLSWSTEVCLASAWATSNEGLRALQRRSSSLESARHCWSLGQSD